MPDPTDKKAKKSWFQRVFGSKGGAQVQTPPAQQPPERPKTPAPSPDDLVRERYLREIAALSAEMDTLLGRDKVSRSVRVAQEALADQRKRAQAVQAQGDFKALLDKHLPAQREALDVLRDAADVHDGERKAFIGYYSAYHHQVKELLAFPAARSPQWLKDGQADVQKLDAAVQACTEPKKDTAEEAYDYEEALKRAKALAKVLEPTLKRKREHEVAMRRYYAELADLKPRLSYADGLSSEPAWATELGLVQTLKSEVIAAQNDFEFIDAIKKLDALDKALVALVAKRLEGLQDQIDDADSAVKVKNVVAKLKGEEISALSATAQVQLLRTLRETAGTEIDGRSAPDLYRARCKLYDNMKMDPDFVNADNINRNEVVQQLRNDPKVAEAKKDWGKWDTKKRLNFLEHVAKQQCKVMGQPEPKIKPFSQAADSSGGVLFGGCDLSMLDGSKTSTITINTHPDANFDDIEEQMNTMLHENAHNYQLDLVARYRKDPAGLSKLSTKERTLLPQIIMWDENANGYVPDGSTYDKQPLEIHAWTFGNEGAAAVLGPQDVTKLAQGELPPNTTSNMA
ncbi:MAG: hypothetical protein WAQ08_02060 [Aquabacterium sp.]|jgi:hypothetical protein|uniref:hypothetical protein n=1 Tax=Aquabacterium sp. TaxID=1872578 RepID=UPI003BAEDE99